MGMTKKEIRAIAQRWIDDIFTQHKLEVIDELHAPDYKRHDTYYPLEGPEAYKVYTGLLFKAAPDIEFKASHIVVEGDLAFIRWTAKGTFTNELQGIPPTNEEISFVGTDLLRIVDGKIVESWPCFDMLGMFFQAIPDLRVALSPILNP